MSEIKLKDVTIMTIDEARIASIAERFQSGEATKQEAFEELVNYNVEVLEAYTEERKVGTRLVQGALKKLKSLLENTVLHTLGLTNTYVQPSLQLAKARIEGCSTALQYVLDNLTENGDTQNGDLPGPLFAPARLIVSMKQLRNKDGETRFVVEDDVLYIRDKAGELRRFGSLSIEGIKDMLRTGTTEKSTLQLINDLVGEFSEDENGKDKPGIIGRQVKKLIEAANAGEEPDSFALDIAETLAQAMFDCREAAIRRNREERAAREAEADMMRQQRRLERARSLGLVREGVVPASTTDQYGEAITSDEEDDG